MLEMLPNAQQWERGPKITAIGGGDRTVHHAPGLEEIYPETSPPW